METDPVVIHPLRSISELQKYFDEDGWLSIKTLLETMGQTTEFKCVRCKSVINNNKDNTVPM